jgi:ankyrin repeat and BTB/POZ domain-containing protein 1
MASVTDGADNNILKKYELEAKLKEEKELMSRGLLRDDNPLDLSSAFDEFLEACRRGDLRRCQELISAGVNINGKDKFDYTPLIIASLCGHFELVRLLLESGALAERNTFQGERAIYNALSDRIRNLLLQYDYSKSTDPLQPWSSHITSLLYKETPTTSDITITSANETFRLHKLLLASRTPYFREKLTTSPDLSTWKLPPNIPVEAFVVVKNYLYLDELPRDLVPPFSSASEEEVFKGIDKLCKHFELEKLWEAVLSADDRRLARNRYQDEVERAHKQVEAFFRETVLKHKMVLETKKVGNIKWPHDNAMFADCILRADEQGDDDEEEEEAVQSNGLPLGPVASDTARGAGEARRSNKSVLYPAHKAFLIRSPYFERMFSSGFLESKTEEFLHVITVDCSPEVLEIILGFLYTDKADCPLDLGLELLYVSDMLLLDRLKTKAAAAISNLGNGNNNALVDRTHLEQAQKDEQQQHADDEGNGSTHTVHDSEPINVYDVMRAAWDLRIQRLEEFCARYIANRLEDYIDEEDFAELIRESASRIKRREETDTIELLDDIRYYLSERFRLRFEDAGLEETFEEEDEVLLDADGNPIPKEEVPAGDAADVVGGQDGNVPANAVVVRTLDGEVVEDEFDADAMNYQILLQKIDGMLERLKLDA